MLIQSIRDPVKDVGGVALLFGSTLHVIYSF